MITAVGVDDVLQGSDPRVGIGHVEAQWVRIGGVRQRGQRSLIDVSSDNGGPLGEQSLHRRPPDTRRAAGDERNLSHEQTSHPPVV